MRLIDAEKIKQSITNKMFKTELHSPVYNTLECIIADIDNQPTAFDMESVIAQFEERIRIFKDFNSDDEIVNVAIKEIQRDLKILNSTANATNGKIGG